MRRNDSFLRDKGGIMGKATGNRRADRMHMRNVDELQCICRHISETIKELESKIESSHREMDETMSELKQKAIEAQKEKKIEEAQEYAAQIKEISEKARENFQGKWFTNTVNQSGKIDLSGDYKKIRVATFEKFMLEAEEKWAKEHKERPLGRNQLTSDLKRCGVITTGKAKTHRPVDDYGKKVSDKNVNQVMEYCISQMEFFARSDSQ